VAGLCVVGLLRHVEVGFPAHPAVVHRLQLRDWPPYRARLTQVYTLVALLGWTKYAAFLATQMNSLLSVGLHVPHTALPLGISFFTFTQIAYLVDLSRREATLERPDRYVLFVSFFPHLIAGPILHHRAVMPQFARLRHLVFDQRNFACGLLFFAIGLAKKVAIADAIAPYVHPVFEGQVSTLGFWPAWQGVLAYALQLYFDFSGYSDMAIGAALMVNIRIPLNFNSPYQATSIIEFWQRWHMSLSAFLRDYLYIPLGGTRRGEFRRYFNLMVTMLLGGLWHGAGLTYLAWGGLHGSYLVINHLWRKSGRALPKPAAGALTFFAVVVAWVFFRAPDLATGRAIVYAMAGFNGAGMPDWLPLTALTCLLAIVVSCPNSQTWVARIRPSWGLGIVAGLAAVAVISLIDKATEFLYYQF
jgi:alginate O-acetyltransferase complex protein AlgI